MKVNEERHTLVTRACLLAVIFNKSIRVRYLIRGTLFMPDCKVLMIMLFNPMTKQDGSLEKLDCSIVQQQMQIKYVVHVKIIYSNQQHAGYRGSGKFLFQIKVLY